MVAYFRDSNIWDNWVKAPGEGPRAVGMCFEHLLGVEENNSKTADHLGTELKAKRMRSAGSRVTAFTMAPQNGDAVARRLFDRYAKQGRDGVMRFTRGFNCTPRRPYVMGGQAVRLAVQNRSISLLGQGDGDEQVLAHWSAEALNTIIEDKLRNLCLAYAETRVEEDREHFRFVDFSYYSGLTIDHFCEFVESGGVTVEFRLSGHDAGLKDHGVAFRISQKRLAKLYPQHRLHIRGVLTPHQQPQL